MRIRQTARKSTATGAANSRDPVQDRMTKLLHTKRERHSAGAAYIKHQQSEASRLSMPARGEYSGSRGKQVTFSSRNDGHEIKLKPKAMAGQVALEEIRRLQKGTQMLIPRAPFHRLIREVTQDIEDKMSTPDVQSGPFKYQMAALEALQEAAEAYMVNLFEDAYMCTIHAKRVTLFTSDMELCRKIRRS